jgi:hypothetical protein
VGVLILSGGRMTQLGLGCAIAFHLALCVDGVGVTLYALAQLAGLVLLLRAERRAAGEQARSQPKHPVQVRS